MVRASLGAVVLLSASFGCGRSTADDHPRTDMIVSIAGAGGSVSGGGQSTGGSSGGAPPASGTGATSAFGGSDSTSGSGGSGAVSGAGGSTSLAGTTSSGGAGGVGISGSSAVGGAPVAGMDGLGAASGSDGSAGDGADGTQPPTPPFDYEIDPEALAGCRSPEEQGCVECCLSTGVPCEYLSGDIDWSQYPGVTPWYSSQHVGEGPCGDSCQPCAQCSKRAEEGLRAIAPRPECDCETQPHMIDACFSNGCACYCETVEGALRVCPPAL